MKEFIKLNKERKNLKAQIFELTYKLEEVERNAISMAIEDKDFDLIIFKWAALERRQRKEKND